MAWLPRPPRKPPGWLAAVVFIVAEVAILWFAVEAAKHGWFS